LTKSVHSKFYSGFHPQQITTTRFRTGYVESDTSDKKCVVMLYNTEASQEEYFSELSVGDVMVFKENGYQICDDSCNLIFEIRNHGEYLKVWDSVFLE
jgi:hypothetical protein